MRSRTRSSSSSAGASSDESTENDGDSDRHSVASSGTTERQKSNKQRNKGKENCESDDSLPVKYRRKNDGGRSRRYDLLDGRDRRSHKTSRLQLSRNCDDYSRSNRNGEYGRRSRSREDRKQRQSGMSRSDERSRAFTSRNRSRSPHSPSFSRCKEIKKEESADDDKDQKSYSLRKNTEDEIWAERRKERDRRGEWGVRNVWGRSPLMHEIHEIYEEYERMEQELRREEEHKPKPLNVDASEVLKNPANEKKKHAKKHKDKKSKKKHMKKHKKLSSESEEEWVEVTAEMREAEAAREKMEEASMIGPAIPDHLVQKQAALVDTTKRVNYGKDMLRGEAAAMASYIAQGKRIPRRGEIGLSSAEISEYEKIGYVMSGTRHKSMEATRLRKENQVMTAEEKRLLSGFTHDERKKKEEIVLQQFKSFIESKKGKS